MDRAEPVSHVTHAPRTFSSRMTFSMLYLFPVLLIIGTGAGFAAAVLQSERAHHGSPPTSPRPDGSAFVPAFIGCALVVLSLLRRYKRVRLVEDSVLEISNYRKTILVPLAAVQTVTQSRWRSGSPVTITFDRDTTFGTSVQFLPPEPYKWAFWEEDNVVDELRNLARAARAAPGPVTRRVSEE